MTTPRFKKGDTVQIINCSAGAASGVWSDVADEIRAKSELASLREQLGAESDSLNAALEDRDHYKCAFEQAEAERDSLKAQNAELLAALEASLEGWDELTRLAKQHGDGRFIGYVFHADRCRAALALLEQP